MRHCLIRLGLFVLLATARAHGHGDVHEAIVTLTEQIASAPKDAALYLRRGDLHRQHGDWPAAAKDFDAAERLDPMLFAVDLVRGQMLAEAGRDEEACAALDRFVAREPANPRGYVARGRALVKAAQPAAGAEDFAAALAHSPQPEPELFIEYARALRAAERPGEALRTLDAGLAKLGPLIALAQEAIDLEESAGHHAAALERIDRMLPSAPRKERWLLRRATLLEKLARPREARESLLAARSAFDTLPVARRGSAALVELSAEIDAALRRLDGR